MQGPWHVLVLDDRHDHARRQAAARLLRLRDVASPFLSRGLPLAGVDPQRRRPRRHLRADDDLAAQVDELEMAAGPGADGPQLPLEADEIALGKPRRARQRQQHRAYACNLGIDRPRQPPGAFFQLGLGPFAFIRRVLVQ